MKESRALKNILLLSGLIGVLLLAFVFDLVITSLAERNAQLGGLDTTLVWIYPMLQLLWMLGAVGLIWLMVGAGGYSRWVSAVFLLVGLVLLYANPILFVNELPDSWYVVVQYLTPGSLLFQAGGAAAALGLVSLFFWKGDQEAEGQNEEPPNAD